MDIKGATHATRLERNANENPSTAAVEVIPLVLSRNVIKVWREFDASKENVIAHVIVGAPLWLLLAQIGL